MVFTVVRDIVMHFLYRAILNEFGDKILLGVKFCGSHLRHSLWKRLLLWEEFCVEPYLRFHFYIVIFHFILEALMALMHS